MKDKFSEYLRRFLASIQKELPGNIIGTSGFIISIWYQVFGKTGRIKY